MIKTGQGDAAIDTPSDEGGESHPDGSAGNAGNNDVAADRSGAAGSNAPAGHDGGVEVGAAETGGGAGAGPVDDACTACEKAKCSQPSGGSGNKTNIYAKELGSYSLCFLGLGLPATQVSAGVCPAQISGPGPTALAGPAMGIAKTQLCDALLKCVHKSNCVDTDCYCGTGVDPNACEAMGFTPTGACITEIENASESTDLLGASGIAANFFDPCLATGAAFVLADYCDANCCQAECNNQSGDPDPTFCNDSSATGAAGAGAAGAGVGAAGAGTAGAGTADVGAAGAGAAGAGAGAAGAGAAAVGAAGSSEAGASGAAGSSGAGGVAGTSGAAGVSGVAGAGLAGTSGAAGEDAGAAGAPPPPSLVTNSTFDTGTAPWQASALATLGHDSNDADGNGQSGSLSVAITAGDPNNAHEVSAVQCLSVTPSSSYKLGANVLIPGINNSLGSIALWFYPSPDCSGAQSGVFSSDSSAMNTWQPIAAMTMVPASAHSVAVRLAVLKPAGQSSAEALFDDVLVTSP